MRFLNFFIFFSFFLISYLSSSDVFDRISKPVYLGLKQFECEDTKENVFNIIKLFIPDNPVIFEAGCCDGLDTISFIKKWKNCTIHTFEANPNFHSKLNALFKNYLNIHFYPIALNNYTGTTQFNVCSYPGSHSILDSSKEYENRYNDKKVIVPCITINDWIKQEKINKIDFMWLDLEGYELFVLEKGSELLEMSKVIYVETNFAEFRKNMTLYKDLKPFLESRGFVEVAHWIQKCPQGNALFIKKDVFENVTKISYPFEFIGSCPYN